MEELTAAKTAPMTNGLSSKATGGTLYTMKPVISSADRFREARLHGEPLEAVVNNTATSSSADSGNASILPLVGIIAFGAATAVAFAAATASAPRECRRCLAKVIPRWLKMA